MACAGAGGSCYAKGVWNPVPRLLLAFGLVAVIVGCGACSAKITNARIDAGPSDATADTSELEDDAEPISDVASEGAIVPPACPDYRPVKGVPCRAGLSCFFPCGTGHDYAIRATCPMGKWVIENTAACEISAPDAAAD